MTKCISFRNSHLGLCNSQNQQELNILVLSCFARRHLKISRKGRGDLSSLPASWEVSCAGLLHGNAEVPIRSSTSREMPSPARVFLSKMQVSTDVQSSAPGLALFRAAYALLLFASMPMKIVAAFLNRLHKTFLLFSYIPNSNASETTGKQRAWADKASQQHGTQVHPSSQVTNADLGNCITLLPDMYCELVQRQANLDASLT